MNNFACIYLQYTMTCTFHFACLILSWLLLGRKLCSWGMPSRKCLGATPLHCSEVTQVFPRGPCAEVQTQTLCMQSLHSSWWPIWCWPNLLLKFFSELYGIQVLMHTYILIRPSIDYFYEVIVHVKALVIDIKQKKNFCFADGLYKRASGHSYEGSPERGLGPRMCPDSVAVFFWITPKCAQALLWAYCSENHAVSGLLYAEHNSSACFVSCPV